MSLRWDPLDCWKWVRPRLVLTSIYLKKGKIAYLYFSVSVGYAAKTGMRPRLLKLS